MAVGHWKHNIFNLMFLGCSNLDRWVHTLGSHAEHITHVQSAFSRSVSLDASKIFSIRRVDCIWDVQKVKGQAVIHKLRQNSNTDGSSGANFGETGICVCEDYKTVAKAVDGQRLIGHVVLVAVKSLLRGDVGMVDLEVCEQHMKEKLVISSFFTRGKK